MILILGDLHAQFHFLPKVIRHAQEIAHIDSIIQLGDFGIFKSTFTKLPRLTKPLYFVEGNHEDFDLLGQLRKNGEGIVQLKKNLFHVGRGTQWEMDGLTWTGLGGSEFFDAYNCPQGSTFTDEEIDITLSKGKTDILISHDGPHGLLIPGHPAFGGGIDVGCKRLNKLYGLSPKIWFFGHHHQTVSMEQHGVRNYGIDCVEWGYGIFDPSTLQFCLRAYNPQ